MATRDEITALLQQFEAGVVTRTDVAQSQARLAQARTQLVQAQGLLAAAVQAYTRLVGHPPSALEPPPSSTRSARTASSPSAKLRICIQK